MGSRINQNFFVDTWRLLHFSHRYHSDSTSSSVSTKRCKQSKWIKFSKSRFIKRKILQWLLHCRNRRQTALKILGEFKQINVNFCFTRNHPKIYGGIEVYQLAQIRQIFEAKFGDDPYFLALLKKKIARKGKIIMQVFE